MSHQTENIIVFGSQFSITFKFFYYSRQSACSYIFRLGILFSNNFLSVICLSAIILFPIKFEFLIFY